MTQKLSNKIVIVDFVEYWRQGLKQAEEFLLVGVLGMIFQPKRTNL